MQLERSSGELASGKVCNTVPVRIPQGATVLLLDCENVGRFDFQMLPADFTLVAFLGNINFLRRLEFISYSRQLGKSVVQLVDVLPGRKNSLDFYITCYLGIFLSERPNAEYIIISADKGFDSLIAHLRALEKNVRRVNTQLEACVPERPCIDTLFSQSYEQLRCLQPRCRPAHIRALRSYLKHIFNDKVLAEEVAAVIERLTASGLMVINEHNRVVYHL